MSQGLGAGPRGYNKCIGLLDAVIYAQDLEPVARWNEICTNFISGQRKTEIFFNELFYGV